MGVQNGTDLAVRVASGSFTATGSGTAIPIQFNFNIALWGTFVGTTVLERTFDGGTTWLPVTYSDGTALSWTAPTSGTWSEPEGGISYRFRCSAFTSGTINWRISQ